MQFVLQILLLDVSPIEDVAAENEEELPGLIFS